MWSELYINDPDILSDVTEIAVKKLGYWIERRLREGRSSPVARFYLHTHTRTHTYTHILMCIYTYTYIYIYLYVCVHVCRSVTAESRSKTGTRFEDILVFRFGVCLPIEQNEGTHFARSDESIEILERTPNVSYDLRRKLSATTSNVSISHFMHDSRSRFPVAATSIILAHHEIMRPVVRRRLDRSILSADFPVSNPCRLKRFAFIPVPFR